MKNLLENKKGITLIALVVTIVVLIILATISVTLVLGDNGIFKQAKKARDSQANAIVKENQDMDRLLGQYNSELGIAKNPYEPDDWEYAWVYDNGEWGEMLTKGDKIEGGIAAKFYKTGKKVDPPAVESLGLDLPEGDEYHLIIELIDGSGEMGVLMTFNGETGVPTGGYAWQKQIIDLMSGSATTYIGAYVTEMVICEGITNIGEGFGIAATSLKEVVIGNTVNSMEKSSFAACSSLTNITIPNSVTSIGNFVFNECSSLTNIIIPDSVNSMGKAIFEDCNSLTSVVIEGNVTSIGDVTFQRCTSLSNVTINSVTSIGDGAFLGCDSLASITIPDSVTSIGDSAFQGCDSLTSITIPNSVTSIGEYAFSGCKSLAKVKLLTTDATKITFGRLVFSSLLQDSKIYVLSEEMKTKLKGTYDITKTTVEVVSAERMEEL